MVMIETPEAVENAGAIAAVDGIDVLHIGASDLSTEMGIPGQYAHERMRAAFETESRDIPNLGPRVSIVDHQGKLIGRFGETPAGTELGSHVAGDHQKVGRVTREPINGPSSA
jgi:2-keto-3-deoxy-L-rhamnonate aldolase RhmA